MRITKSRLRKLILKEITQVPVQIKAGLKQAMFDSKFWTLSNNIDDVDLVTETEFSTPAVEKLMDALNNEATKSMQDLYFLLHVDEDESYILGPDDQYGYYPNNWMLRGYYSGPQNGKHVIVIIFRPLSHNYRLQDLNPNELVGKLSRTINHEIIHVEQLKKQAISKGISEEQAWEELLADKKQIPQTQGRSEYLSLHNEIDAYAHEAAEELLSLYNSEEAMDILRYGNPNSTPIIKDYLHWLQKKHRQPALNNFMSKVYSQIKSQVSQKI